MSEGPESLAVLVADAEDGGARLDRFIAGRLAEVSRSRIAQLVRGGLVAGPGGTIVETSYRVKPGERFTVTLPKAAEAEPRGEAMALDVLYEDAHLIVIDKPAGLVVHPGAGNPAGTLVNALIAHCGTSLSGIGGVKRPGIVHRLDKETSGVMVAAKTDAAHQRLARDFAAHSVERLYEAVCGGAPRPRKGTIDAPLARSTRNRLEMAVVAAERTGSRRAVTHYEVVETFGAARLGQVGRAIAALVECRLETGRTHQIRVHLASLGHPLIGDPVYGRRAGLAGLKPGDPAADRAITALAGFRRQALHAALLGFRHPVTGAALSFRRPPPADFTALLAALRDLDATVHR